MLFQYLRVFVLISRLPSSLRDSQPSGVCRFCSVNRLDFLEDLKIACFGTEKIKHATAIYTHSEWPLHQASLVESDERVFNKGPLRGGFLANSSLVAWSSVLQKEPIGLYTLQKGMLLMDTSAL